MAKKSTINALEIANNVNFKPYVDAIPAIPANLPKDESGKEYRKRASLLLDAYVEEIEKLGMTNEQSEAVVIVTNTFLFQTVRGNYPSYQNRETYAGKLAHSILSDIERKASEKAEKALANLSADQLRARLAELEAGG